MPSIKEFSDNDATSSALLLAPWQLFNVLHLFIEEKCTLPFITRYRQDNTGGLDELQLKSIVKAWERYNALETKRETALKQLCKKNALDSRILEKLKQAKTIAELEDVMLPFRTKRTTLSQRAIDKGLEPIALELISQKEDGHEWKVFKPSDYVSKKKGLVTHDDVLSGIGHIMAERIAQRTDIRSFLRSFYSKNALLSCKMKTVQKTNIEHESSKTINHDISTNKHSNSLHKVAERYEQYASFKGFTRHLKAYQILAINRGERDGVLSINIQLEEDRKKQAIRFMTDNLVKNTTWNINKHVAILLKNACQDSFKRLLTSSLANELHSQLNEKAIATSLSYFSRNLCSLLLTKPIFLKSDNCILGIDPGYRHGSKYAVIDSSGKCLISGVVFPAPPKNEKTQAMKELTCVIKKYKIDYIAIGNGSGSAEAEECINDLLKELELHNPIISNFSKEDRATKSEKMDGHEVPFILPLYTVVNEDGASVYSVSDLAIKELPTMNASQRSAVSLARRLQDPLAELIKIDVCSLGVGMYQHDIAKDLLKSELDLVVQSCVSKIGIDVNTASESLLCAIPGMNKLRAHAIVSYREDHGCFSSRTDLKNVSGIGPKVYQQSAGFLRVYNGNCYFDATFIHPEWYELACVIVEKVFRIPLKQLEKNTTQLNIADTLKKAVMLRFSNDLTDEELERFMKENSLIGKHTVLSIIQALREDYRYDIRNNSMWCPLFRRPENVNHLLTIGASLQGRVVNIVEFGAFIDVGIPGYTALLHRSQMSSSLETLMIGEALSIEVLDVNKTTKRLSVRETNAQNETPKKEKRLKT